MPSQPCLLICLGFPIGDYKTASEAVREGFRFLTELRDMR